MRSERRSGRVLLPRTGIGVDVHPFDAQRELWVAGLYWPGEQGLSGHSDGDVVAHAACDALLSASGLGDLGAQFGTSEPHWADASGVALLRETARRVSAAGFEVGNVAVQMIGERPRLGARRDEAQAALSGALGAAVSLAATTTDRLGLAGRGEGLVAVATALVYPSSRGGRSTPTRSGRWARGPYSWSRDASPLRHGQPPGP